MTDASVGYKPVHNFNGSAPSYTVFQNSLYVFVLKGGTGLVTGMEIEYLSETSRESGAASENISVLVPGCKDQIVRLWDKERLAVHLLEKLEVRGNALRDRVSRSYVPYDSPLVSPAPGEVAGSTDDCLEGLGVMGGMHSNEAHTGINACLYLRYKLIGNLAVSQMSPPHKHVGGIKKLVREPLLRIVKSSKSGLHVIALNELLYSSVYTVGRDKARVFFPNYARDEIRSK